jgi:cob(I)alamin adenosyltransferase
MERGLVHIYTGEGKGKTTAAVGLGLRAAGCGCRVCFLQFFKDGGFTCGEADAVKKLGGNFKFKRFDIAHPLFKKVTAAELKPRLKKAVDEARKLIKDGRFDLVILDEILVGVPEGFISEKIVLDIIRNKPATVELVLTGRGASKRLIGAADYVTYMKDIKHPFRDGICARKGIEF